MALGRRAFLKRAFWGMAGLMAGDAFGVEPEWLEVVHQDFSHLGLGKTVVQWTDLHYRGDRSWAERIVTATKQANPDLVMFTGDLVDLQDTTYLFEALEWLEAVGVPVYGVSGNHDPMDGTSMRKFREGAKATGGRWLVNEGVDLGDFVLHGTTGPFGLRRVETKPKVLLCHYPVVGEWAGPQPYGLILSGHSHGGQCRIPVLGAVVLPKWVGRYVAGRYQSPAGPLYVGRGLGTSTLPVRFACRPELTVLKL